MTSSPFISICILSYNRPETLSRLLGTIDTKKCEDVEIIVCEDFSPRRNEIAKVVDGFSRSSAFKTRYLENERNLGFDRTLSKLLESASGDWVIFMGDDDEFVPGALDKMWCFLRSNPGLGYVMKSHYLLHENRAPEKFRYFKKTTFFPKGKETYVNLFRRSVFIAGFTIRRKFSNSFITDQFDGTMLMQLYLLAEVTLRHPAAYFDEPFTQQYASHAHNLKDVMFDRDNQKFISRRPTLDISLKFLKSFSEITSFIDQKYSIQSTSQIKRDMSKYFYPSLSVHRDAGRIVFLKYVKELNKLGFNVTAYYYIYVLLLLIFGRRLCDFGIYMIKRILGYTPQL